ncbi:MAG: EamA family transporter [Eubacteriales bacterium]|nr:EamA family transporter [Bacillota bacterium]MBV1728436.1 EamA family transporter [Desulforudis sp.]MDP3050284.1 EamA family transporter [Eubacteriales bacterium]MDQ7788924.1 EamA family transporter [Clostridia bacterium]MBU4555025.1 EamA family transporter [Bacillota bacterium]
MNKTYLALLAYLIVCIVWGSTYLAIRIGVQDIPFLLFAGLRFTIAGAIMLTVARLCGWAFPSSWKDYRALAIVGLLLLFGGNGLVCWAEQWLDSSLTALLIATVPLFMATIQNLLPGGPRIGRLGWLGLFIGFAGVASLVHPTTHVGTDILPAMIGVLAASLLWAIGSVYSSRRVVTGAMLTGVGVQMLVAGICLCGVAIINGDTSLAGASPESLWALLYLIFIGSLLAYSAFMYMLKVLPPAKAGTYAYVNPVVAVALGALILKEPVTLETVLAAAVILVGVVLVQTSKIAPAPETVVEEPVAAHKAQA